MKPLLIIRTGRAPASIRARHGDSPHWFRISARLAPAQIRVVTVDAGEALPPPIEASGALITGSAAMVTERALWSERTAEWIVRAMERELPLFGVCYGHQLMAHALGGRVDYLPGGREIGTMPLQRLDAAANDALAADLPATFRAHTTHEQSVLEPPQGAIVLARSARDPHHFLRYGPHAVSVQFHPEFSVDVMRAYLHYKHDDMRREGLNPAQTLRQVAATPTARQLLRRFASRYGLIETTNDEPDARLSAHARASGTA